jgi:glyoxylase-like metal-dependent hydrolase (beta-lactamase superfamily II)
VPRMKGESGESAGEILDGVWRFEALHPAWTEEEGGEEGWEPLVGWWAVSSREGLVLVDPLVEDWPELDRLVDAQDGCAAIVRTVHWHQRSIAGAAKRYRAAVWARPPSAGEAAPPYDHPVRDREDLLGRLTVLDVERQDEIALWLSAQRALIFGDAMLRRGAGELRVCPDSWIQPPGGPGRLRSLLRDLTAFPVEHVLVSHGPLVLGDGERSLREATS